MSADRFKQAGKTSSSGSWNNYGYGLGDPVNWRDPHGRDVCPPEDGDEDCGEDPSGGDPGPGYCDVNPSDASCGGTGTGSSGSPGGGNNSSQQITNAVAGAGDRIFNADCAGIFLSASNNTASNRQGLSIELDSLLDGNTIRQISSANLPSGTSSNVPAFTTGPDGIIYLVSGGAFFTGTVNGKPLGGFASGMSLSNFDQLVILHEFLHYTGVAGPDSQVKRSPCQMALL